MPIDPLTGTIISNVIGQGVNQGAQWLQNQFNQNQAGQQQDWNQQNQNNQNHWNLEQWNRQNFYNSPAEQMKRFKKAGLNPHLIYGKGSAGNAEGLKSADVKGYTRAQAANVDRGVDLFGDYNRMQNIQAQTDNTKQATELSKSEELLKSIQASNAIITGKGQKFDLKFKSDMRNTQQSILEENLSKMQADARKSTADADLAVKNMPVQHKKLLQELENLKRTGKNTQLKNTILKWENKLAKQGFTKSDSPLLRQLSAYKQWALKKFKNATTHPFTRTTKY